MVHVKALYPLASHLGSRLPGPGSGLRAGALGLACVLVFAGCARNDGFEIRTGTTQAASDSGGASDGGASSAAERTPTAAASATPSENPHDPLASATAGAPRYESAETFEGAADFEASAPGASITRESLAQLLADTASAAADGSALALESVTCEAALNVSSGKLASTTCTANTVENTLHTFLVTGERRPGSMHVFFQLQA